MDIWQWVRDVRTQLRAAGNLPLLTAMDDISHYTCNDRHDKVDALYPQALNLARKHSNPWIEVYMRHWYLQSQVLHRHNAKGMVSEAVDLLEFSSRDNTKNCPQSICVVQDLASCYGKADGPGFAEERMAVCEETLTRITPSWSCFDCISTEYINALLDAERYQTLLDEIKSRRQSILKAVGHLDGAEFKIEETQALIALGRLDEAKQVIESAHNPAAGISFTRYRSALLAIIYARQGDFEAAQQHVVPFDDVLSAHSHFKYWCEYQYVVASAQLEENTAEINSGFNTIAEKLKENGGIRDTITVSHWQADLALARMDLFSVEICIERINEMLPQLQQDLGASNALFELNKRFNQAQTGTATDQIKVLDNPQDYLTQPQAWSLTELQQAYNDNPEDHGFLVIFVDALSEHGYLNKARTLIEAHLSLHQPNPALLTSYGHTLLLSKDVDTFDQYFNALDMQNLSTNTATTVYLMQYHRNFSKSPKTALDYLQKVLAQMPNDKDMLIRATELAMTAQDYQLAIDYRTRLIDQGGDGIGNHHWDRMIPATILGQWDLIRQSCRFLDIEVDDDEGPIHINWGDIRIQLTNEDGDLTVLRAKRTGLVSATIVQMSPPYAPQYFADEVVFDASPLNRLDHEDEEGYACDSEGFYTHVFQSVKTLSKTPHFFFCIDGVYPGDSNWQTLKEKMEKLGITVSRRSDEGYILTRQDDDSEHPAIYALLACPEQTDLTKVNQTLLGLADIFDGPLIWPQLAEKLGDRDLLELQAEVELLYDIE